MSLGFDDIFALSGAGSTFLQQQQQLMPSIATSVQQTISPPVAMATKAISTSNNNLPQSQSAKLLSPLAVVSTTAATLTTASSTSSVSSCESGVILSNSSICSSANNSPPSSATLVADVLLSSSPLANMSGSVMPNGLNEMSRPTSATAQQTLDENSPQVSASKSSLSSLSSSSASCPAMTAMASSTVASMSSNTAAPSSAQLLLNGMNGMISLNSHQHHHQQQQQQQHHQILAEDPRTLQLALELSMVGLHDTAASSPAATTNTMQHLQNLQQLHQQTQQHQQPQHNHQFNHKQQGTPSGMQQKQSQQQLKPPQYDLNTLNAISAAVAAAATANNTHSIINNQNAITQFAAANALLPAIEDRSKKSQNMTECVPVPSSEHVAEIVGRQGCKIKALRAKTNTYIKTPVRGEEPVFVVTGRKEDVAKAKREILSAAEHFSLIRATRRPLFDGGAGGNNCSGSTGGTGSGGGGTGNSGGGGGGAGSGGSGASGKTPLGVTPGRGQITIQVRVPYRVVGLVVGPKGATIKHIQQETQTYIVTPSRDKDPVFEVTGAPENVQSARKQIEAHIALRTGNLSGGSSAAGSTPVAGVEPSVPTVHTTINTLSQMLNEDINQEFLTSLYKNGICSSFNYVENCANGATPADLVSPGSNLNLVNGGNPTASANNNGTNNNHVLMSLIATNNFQMQNNEYISSMMAENGGGMRVDIDNLQQNQQQQQQQHQHTNGHQMHNNIQQANLCNLTFNNMNSLSMNTIGMVSGGNAASANTSIVTNANVMTRSCSSASSTTSSKSANNGGGSGCDSTNSSRPELINIWKNLSDSLDVDEGIGESPNIWTLQTTGIAGLTNCPSSSTSISPTDSLLGELTAAARAGVATTAVTATVNGYSYTNVSNSNNKAANGGIAHLMTSTQREPSAAPESGANGSSTANNAHVVLQQPSNMATIRRECLVCNEKAVTAALVPCGHNMFCMDCANRICSTADSICPVCNLSVYHAMRILP